MMKKTEFKNFQRRGFLRGITAAAGIARSAPLFFGAAASPAFPAEGEASGSETGKPSG